MDRCYSSGTGGEATYPGAPRVVAAATSVPQSGRPVTSRSGYSGARARAPDPVDEAMTTTLNVVVALLVLIFISPLLIALAIAVYAQDRGPVFFAHRRVGRGGKAFYCLKFRSMAADSERRLADLLATSAAARAEWARDHKLREDPRVTRLGAFLRRSSLDALPQLINVLRGEMSLVGPRPIVEAEAARYGWRFRYYCDVKPGITGLWQVSSSNDTTYRRRVAVDCVYAVRRNVVLDAAILIRTIPAVLSRGA